MSATWPALALPPGVTLYFARHGETEANVAHRFQGRTLDTPLTALGRDQAAALAAILKTRVDDPARLSFVSSPLARARATMEIVRAGLGLEGPWATDARIVEIDLGTWDGQTDTEASAADPAFYELRTFDKWNVAPPGGETYADVAARAEAWVASLTADTFAISHGAFTRILRGRFAGLTARAMSDLDEPQGVVFRVRGSAVERLERA
jgi:broad specificity phosphatase PhoE